MRSERKKKTTVLGLFEKEGGGAILLHQLGRSEEHHTGMTLLLHIHIFHTWV